MTARFVPAGDRLVVNTATERPIGRSIFEKIMDEARRWWPSKTAEELAVVLECDVRSAERYLAGHRTPDANAVLRLMRDGMITGKIIEIVAAEMTPQRQAAFWKDVAKAARRAELLEERARLDRELRQVGG